MSSYSALVKEYREFSYPDVVSRDEVIRELPAPAQANLVHIITGMRRCGKTYYLYQLIRSLLARGVDPDLAFYFDFFDSRLAPLEPAVMDDVLDEYFRQVPRAREQGCYLFLDEVQECEAWQGFCQRVAEREKVTLVITGSSSKLTSEEISTQFRGRSHSHEMLPLSFAEYCSFHGLPAREEAQEPSSRTRIALESAFDRYLVEGGFPGVQRLVPEDRIEVLQGYVRDVVARDVVERYGREELSLANQIALYGLRKTACELSVNNLSEQLTALGFKAHWKRVNTLLELMKQAYLVHELAALSVSLKDATTHVPKLYAADPGISFAVSRAVQEDVGQRFETAVYLELRRRCRGKRTEAIASYPVPGSVKKVDFLVGDALASEPYRLIQASLSLENPKTRKRETEALEAAMQTTCLTEGWIVTLRERGEIESEAGAIHVVPAWQWFLAETPAPTQPPGTDTILTRNRKQRQRDRASCASPRNALAEA